MKKYLILFIVAISVSLFIGCGSDDDLSPPNYVTFETGPANVGVDVDGSTSYDVTVYTANVTGSDRTFDVVVNEDASSLSPEAYSVPATVTVPGGTNQGVLTVDISDIDISANGETLELSLALGEGYYVGSSIVLNVAQVCPYPEFTLNFLFDGYASEITWEVKDSADNILFEGGGYEDGAASASRALCLSAGDYTFTVYDAYGDGLSYPTDGSITLSYGEEQIAVITGDFGTDESVAFTLD